MATQRIGSNRISNLAVTGDKITNYSVTGEKLSNTAITDSLGYTAGNAGYHGIPGSGHSGQREHSAGHRHRYQRA